MDLPFVSIIIPAYNEEKYLSKCLSSISQLDYPSESIEVIVVDNGSTDRTREIAMSYGTKVVDCPKTMVSGARNLGARVATGSILAFIDADCVATTQWLLVAVKLLGQQNSVVGSGYSNPVDSSWLVRAWFADPVSEQRRVHALPGGNIIIRKELFYELNGFDDSLATGEDAEFCARAAKKVAIISEPSIKVYHYGVPQTLIQFFKREIWLGLGAFGTFRINRYDKPLLGTLAFLVITLAQVIGVACSISIGAVSAFLVISTIMLPLLLVISALYRLGQVRSTLHFLQLAILFYFYYLGRSISLIFLLARKDYYHSNKS